MIGYDLVLKKLSSLKVDKACGPDCIQAVVLKECAHALSLPITLIFRKSVRDSQLPIQWLSANVCPLFKKGDKLLPSNYRPVSLTSIVCKILESILREKLEKYFYENGLISPNQHGFVKQKSCSTNLIETIDFISDLISKGKPVDVVYLDFAKAFDSVPHKRLIKKMETYGVRGKLIKWIIAFLKNRRQRVVQGESKSSWCEVLSGVPQGSVLGPFLFVIFINDLVEGMKNSVKLYADDTKVMSKVSNLNESQLLQKDLQDAYEWSKKWLLDFNLLKCVVMHYGANNPCFTYEMGPTT